MAIELATQFQAYTDEQFYSESKTSLVTNKDFSFDGAKTIKLYKMQSTEMEDFNRNGPILDGNKSQYGTISTLQATTETFTINKDRSFTFEVDKMDTDETKMQVAAASALARQQREKVFPEIDSYVYSVMAANAGIKPEAAALTAENIYTQIITANAQMDDAEVPASDRVLILTPTAYTLLKQSKATFDNQDIGAELRKKGVIAQLDGLNVVKMWAVISVLRLTLPPLWRCTTTAAPKPSILQMKFTSAACQMKPLPLRSGRTALTMWENPGRTPSQAQKRPRNRLFIATVQNPRACTIYGNTACRLALASSAPAV